MAAAVYAAAAISYYKWMVEFMNNTIDMTRGRPIPLLLKFAYPIMLTSILQQLYSLADSMIVGRFLGISAFAAVGAAGFIAWLPQNMLLGLTHGFSIVLSQQFGAGDKAGFKLANRRAAILSAGFTVFFTIVLIIFRDKLLALLKTPAELMEYARDYLLIIYLGLIFHGMFNWAASALRAMGDSKTPMIAMFASSAINIALDIVLIKLIPLGVAGVALATVMAQLASLCICLYKLHSAYPEFPPLAKAIPDGSIGQLLKMGLPPMFRDGVIAVGGLYVQRVINTFGVAFVAGMTAANCYFSILSMLGGSLEGAVATYCGQNTGANRNDRVRSGVRSGALLTLIFACITILAAYFSAPYLIRLITGDSAAEALKTGIFALRCSACFLPALHLLFLYRAALQGMGDAVTPMLSGFMELGMRVVCVLALTEYIGPVAACIADGLGWLAAAILLMAKYLFTLQRFGSET